MKNNLIKYYQKRAKEYDLVYQKPERQVDLKILKKYLQRAFKYKYIKEIACGTGYWTRIIAETAKFIYATDINAEVLAIAKENSPEYPNYLFVQLDLWSFIHKEETLDGIFGGFIWSHILKADLPRFLNLMKRFILKEGSLIFIDNKYVEGSSTPIARTDENGNTFQIRKLQNGAEYEVLKNFPAEEEIAKLITDLSLKMEWIELDYYWILKLKKSR